MNSINVMVSIDSPLWEGTFDFRITSTMKVKEVIEKVINCMVQLGLPTELENQTNGMILCTGNKVLSKDCTLLDYGITSGSKLLIV